MSGELEALLRLVSEGRITAEEAAPIVAALEEKARLDARGPAPGRARAPARAPAGPRLARAGARPAVARALPRSSSRIESCASTWPRTAAR